ncbi:hypothetical protein BDP55DRAFT_638817 [Colletotrichum godetiae]|uniref:Uncharacterized protein n=1 Tax=Colletotrichum godetiae TaxID=1209918 RepID=A0AAJ0ELB7_9PEZI|nr:uncharacterized protein BDP55DRAFT_638817 [Colletotrichum godetiae]KAK1657360.1 hypothetical protein BDP55DRAFT_638817 [Colletotrichum godetiae]
MDLMLVGMGGHIQTLPSGEFTTNLLILSQDSSLPESRLSQDGLSTPTGVDTAAETPNSSQKADADSDNTCRSDHDLDRAADIALSHCLVLILTSSAVPFRNDQSAEVLHEEGLFSSIDWDDDGFSCYDVEYGHASNGSSVFDDTLILKLNNQSQGQ